MATISDIHGVMMLTANDNVVASYNRNKGSFEDRSIKFWKESIKDNHIAIDIGSYTGLYAMVAAKENDNAISVAIEPIGKHKERIEENKKLNKLENLMIMHGAVSTNKNENVMFFSNSNVLNSSATFKQRSETFGQEQVHVIDSLEFDDAVSVIKIDVESRELDVLKVLHPLLLKDKPNLIVEVLGDRAELDITRHLSKYDYRFNHVDKRNLLCY